VLGYSRLVHRLSQLCCIGFLTCSSLGVVVWGQQPAASADPLASLRTVSLTVWESGHASLLGWGVIQASLTKDFPQLRVTFRLVDAQDFLLLWLRHERKAHCRTWSSSTIDSRRAR
jgi:hypothetical protein